MAKRWMTRWADPWAARWTRWRERWLRGRSGMAGVAIPDELWHACLHDHPFTANSPPHLLARLRPMCQQFLASKEFHGAHGLQVTDAMALAIALQACLPVLHLGLRWYDDFVGIVVHPGAMRARRVHEDEHGLVHEFSEDLTGEAADQGPVTLSWEDVAQAAETASEGYNVVIHEFVHKLDLRGGQANACPPLPAGFMGLASARQARAHWQATLQPAYEEFRQAVLAAERFAPLVPQPWLDAYGATSPSEFFAVSAEAFFVARAEFAREFPTLLPLYRAFFEGPPGPAPLTS